MRGFSSGFPRGSAGAGLLLLRFCLAAQLLCQGAGTSAWWQTTLATALALLLAAGLLTPVTAALCALWHLLCLTQAGSVQAQLIAAATAAALMLAGPGAYAADARLFGRRTILM